MATLWGKWLEDSDHRAENPDSIIVRALPEEYERIGPLPDRNKHIMQGTPHAIIEQPDGSFKQDDSIPVFTETAPDREIVKQIARKVEVDVPDERLADWMRGNA